jgi:pyruvate dehydrogenase E1 component alpha subunit
MAALWKLPVLFVCENNKYGMGTSIQRSAADTNYYSRGDFVPGVRIQANNVFAVKEGVRYAMEHARKGNGPMVVEMETYRYYGHSMTDPGISYRYFSFLVIINCKSRTREEVNAYRSGRDPIDKVKNLLLTYKLSTEEELTVTNFFIFV